MTKVSNIWTEKYRPKKLDGYVFRDNRLKNQVKTWIEEKDFTNLLITGSSGLGKSTLAQILIKETGVYDGDVLYINASEQTGIDTVRDKIQNFVMTIPRGNFKVVLLEEAGNMSVQAQSSLLRMMEDYSSTARFILTGNYIHKFLPSVKSRTQGIEIQKLDIDEFRIRLAEILTEENINFDIETLDSYIQISYPDLRKCINTIQLNCHKGSLLRPTDAEDNGTADWQIVAVDLFKKGKIAEGRKLICSQIRPEEIEDFFRLCYRNLDWWGKSSDSQDTAVVLIRDAMVKHAVCADAEINLAALLIELSNINNK